MEACIARGDAQATTARWAAIGIVGRIWRAVQDDVAGRAAAAFLDSQSRTEADDRGNVVIEVSDNGPGVPDDIANKIFVPFFTTKEEGSGVGLALARQVMTAHGGFVRLSRNEKGGALFTLTF